MCKKYILIGVVYILIGVNVTSSLSITNNINLKNEIGNNQELDIIIGEIKDGRGLTVEIFNEGNVEYENIQLRIDIESGKFIFIPKKVYEISFLAAGESTKIQIPLIGFSFGIYYDHPILHIDASLPNGKTSEKRISVRLFGQNTRILKELPEEKEIFDGYTLFGPEYSRYIYLINNNGKILHYWRSIYIQGFGTYLLENGNLIRLCLPRDNPTFRSGGIAGRVEIFNEDSDLLWEFEYTNEEHCAHHDIEPLPNGNVLLIAWEYKTREEAIAAGRDPDRLKSNALWPDHIIELKQTGPSTGEIVWEWHVWDHLIQDFDETKDNYGVVEDHPELIDINFGPTNADWNHINSIDYNEKLDQIVLSPRYFNEIWVIDHSTSTEEAAGHTGGNSGKGGDILYRWGNPQSYRAGNANDQQFFAMHGTVWIEEGYLGEGNLLVFNNGDMNRRYSSVDEIVTPVDVNGNYSYTPGQAYDPEEPIWIYTAENPSELFSGLLSNAQRLPNGNTILCSAQQGLFLEVTPEKNVVWEYKNKLPTPLANAVARVEKYSKDYPGIPNAININSNRKNLNELIDRIETILHK
jgi:hypothetical protein